MTTKLKVQKREGPAFAADLDQLARSVKSLGKKDRLILAGQLILCSLEPLKGTSSYVSQPARSAVRRMPWQKGASRSINVSIDKEALSVVVRARQKPVFAVDALLRYGQRLKGSEEFVVLGAFEGSQSTQVILLHFRKGELVALNEYTLCATTVHTFDSDLHVLTERLRMAHAQAHFHWCGPLAAPKSQAFTVAPASVWLLAPPQNLTLSGKPSFVRRHGLSILVVAMSAAGYAGAIYVPYVQYEVAKKALAVESAQLPSQYQFQSERLMLLRARQSFFELQKNGDARLAQFKLVLGALAAEKDLLVKDARLTSTLDLTRRPGQAPGTKSSDFELVVEVPRAEGQTALAQSQPLLQSLSASMGMTLRLATTDAYHDIEKSGSSDGKARRQYRIQGDFGRAS